jgi:hypothetical protein
MLQRKSPAPGIRRHGAGWQTSVKVRGERAWEQWPLETPVQEMIEWLKDARAELRLLAKARPGAGTFEATHGSISGVRM